MKLQKQIGVAAMSQAIKTYMDHKSTGKFLSSENALQTLASQEARLFYNDGIVSSPARLFKAPTTSKVSELGEREEIEAFYRESFLFSYHHSVTTSGTTTYEEDMQDWHKMTFG